VSHKEKAHKEPSLLAPKVRGQPLLEIYTAEVGFSREKNDAQSLP